MIDLERIEIQQKLLNKTLKLISERLYDCNVQSKLGFLICIEQEEIIYEIKKIDNVFKMIDRSIDVGNYKKAIMLCCYLNNITDKVVNIVLNYSA